MSLDQGSSQNKACNAAAVQGVSPDDFKRALKAIDVDEVRRCLEIDRDLVNKTFRWYSYDRLGLVYVVREYRLSGSGRSVLELVELVRVLLDHKAGINAVHLWYALLYALRCAVAYNLVEVVELLLQYQAQVDERDADIRTPLFCVTRDDLGNTPLHYAKTVELARLLIAHGADVNSKNYGGYTPLSYCRNVELARLLIAHGADVSTTVKFGKHKPVWFSVMRENWGDLEKLKDLFEHGVDLQGEKGIRALHLAARYGTLEIMEFLLDQGVHIDAKVTADGGTPLHCAMRRGWVRGVQLLLQRGADVKATDRHGKTPLADISSFHEAGAEEVAELLVEHIVTEGKKVPTLKHVPRQICGYMMEQIVKHPKVDLNARVSADGNTLAFDLIEKLHKKVDLYRPIFMLLIEYGADVKAKHEESGRTLLHFAAAGSKRVEFHSEVQLLLEKGSDVNAIDNHGFTPLLYALYHGHRDIVRILVDHGADVNIAHKDHGTPLSMARKRNEESTMQLLLDAGAQVDGTSKDGVTALLACVRMDLVRYATFLLNRGADIHAADLQGSTPFLEACRRRRLDVIYCLIRSTSQHGRLGLLSEVSFPSAA